MDIKKIYGKSAEIIKKIPPVLVSVGYRIKEIFLSVKNVLTVFMHTPGGYKGEDRSVNRRLALIIGAVLFLNYFMFCYYTDKNIFAIFPSVPPVSDQREVTLYLPAPDGSTLIEETCSASEFSSDERFVQFMFRAVVRGSRYQNTSMAVPADMNIRKIWIGSPEEGFCLVDCEVSPLRSGITPVPGSEALFRSALEKTVTANIPSIKKVQVLTGGIPDCRLW